MLLPNLDRELLFSDFVQYSEQTDIECNVENKQFGDYEFCLGAKFRYGRNYVHYKNGLFYLKRSTSSTGTTNVLCIYDLINDTMLESYIDEHFERLVKETITSIFKTRPDLYNQHKNARELEIFNTKLKLKFNEFLDKYVNIHLDFSDFNRDESNQITRLNITTTKDKSMYQLYVSCIINGDRKYTTSGGYSFNIHGLLSRIKTDYPIVIDFLDSKVRRKVKIDNFLNNESK